MVVIISIPNSSLNLCCTTSRCSKPRKPHLKPLPSTGILEACTKIPPSFNCNLSRDFLSCGYSSLFSGYIPQKTYGFIFTNPGSLSHLLPTWVMVSPGAQSWMFRILAITYPTIPAERSSVSSFFGVKTPTESILYSRPLLKNMIFVFFFIWPL